MLPNLPPFKAVAQFELREFWTRYPDNDVRRVILEVERYRRAFAEIDRHHQSIEQAWKDVKGGHLVAHYLMRQVVMNEREHGGLASTARAATTFSRCKSSSVRYRARLSSRCADAQGCALHPHSLAVPRADLHS